MNEKRVVLFATSELSKASLLKAHVDQFTRTDGATVQAHDTKVQAAHAAGAGDLTRHPQYTRADHEYLKGKGWSDSQIKTRWDEEHAKGRAPQQVNKHKPSSAFGPGQ